MAVNVIIRQDLESKNLFIDLDHIDDKYPIEQSYVRMPHMDAVLSIELLEDKKVRFTYQVILDPSGYIPSILVNLMLKDIPYYTLRRMKRVLQSDAYTGERETYIQYPEEW